MAIKMEIMASAVAPKGLHQHPTGKGKQGQVRGAGPFAKVRILRDSHRRVFFLMLVLQRDTCSCEEQSVSARNLCDRGSRSRLPFLLSFVYCLLHLAPSIVHFGTREPSTSSQVPPQSPFSYLPLLFCFDQQDYVLILARRDAGWEGKLRSPTRGPGVDFWDTFSQHTGDSQLFSLSRGTMNVSNIDGDVRTAPPSGIWGNSAGWAPAHRQKGAMREQANERITRYVFFGKTTARTAYNVGTNPARKLWPEEGSKKGVRRLSSQSSGDVRGWSGVVHLQSFRGTTSRLRAQKNTIWGPKNQATCKRIVAKERQQGSSTIRGRRG